MDLLNKDELKQCLIEKGIEEADAQVLYEENVDGKDFMKITNDDLKDIGFKLGNRKKILKIIEDHSTMETPSFSVIPEFNNTMELESVAQVVTCEFHTTTPQSEPVSKYSKPETIPVLQNINASDKGKQILAKLKRSDKVISSNDIHKIIRIIVGSAVKDLQTTYPSTEQKINIAKAIVLRIPELKGKREGTEGYEQYFDPVSKGGMIEWRLKTLRNTLSPSKKKHQKRKNISDATTSEVVIDDDEDADDDDEELESKISWLQYENPTELHKKEIFSAMKETHKARRKYIIQNKSSITDTLKKFPKFKDFNGDLIDAEFNMLYPEAGELLLGRFPSFYCPRIRKYTEEKRHDIFERLSDISDENLGAFLMLADLLPVQGLRKKKPCLESNQSTPKPKFPSDFLLRFLGVNTDLQSEIKNKQSGFQPLLFCVGDNTESPSKLKYFLCLDNEIVDVGYSVVKAFDLLYKCHYAFNVEYNRPCMFFFIFFDYIIYKIKKGATKAPIENLSLILERIMV